MKTRLWTCRAILLGTLLLPATLPARAEVCVPHVFGSHMVVQCDRPIRIWGWAEPGERVRVTLAETTESTEADGEGHWRVSLPALPAGGPHAIEIAGTNTIRLDDVLMGEVWLCSGQSNMWRPLYWSQRKWGVIDYEREIAAADFPRLRLLNLARVPGEDFPNPPRATPVDDVVGHWQRSAPEVAANFSATAQFFGRKLLAELDVPVGLINASYGGSTVEAWVPPSGFRQVPEVRGLADQVEARGADAEMTRKSPSGLFNSLIHPIVPIEIRGVLWYQGESNIGDGPRYAPKMKALILSWRELWGREDLPFYFVQLPPFRYGSDPYRLPLLREAQAAALELPKTGMVVTLDVGDLTDIHPRKKRQVGERLACLALANDYGRHDLPCFGPVFRTARFEGNEVHIDFDHADGLSSRNGKPLDGFEIAGPNGRFVSAEATIDGQAVVVQTPSVKEPKAVRFAWHQEAEPNLVNAAGLPAAPFRYHHNKN